MPHRKDEAEIRAEIRAAGGHGGLYHYQTGRFVRAARKIDRMNEGIFTIKHNGEWVDVYVGD